MPFYQCLKTVDRDVYCSSTRFRNHTEGAGWVTACMAAHGITGAQLLGKPYEAASEPRGAIVWPAAG